MKRNTRLALVALHMAMTGPAMAATDHAAHSHEHGSAVASLQLNAGQKWATDAALRQGMHNIRQTMAASLHEIHENRLSAKNYATLAGKVTHEVGEIVANCKLAPEADAQLHLIVADLLAGAEQMAGKTKTENRQRGAVGVIGALEKYGTYFADRDFKPIAH